MVHPVPGARISADYRRAGRHWSLGWHTGRDYAAPVGTPIYSATHGVVIAANAHDSAYGYKVIIVEPGGREVWYCHMPANAATVRPGDKVEAGQRIGAVGDTGNTTGPHLHMEVRIRGGRFAPETFRDPAAAVAFRPKPIKYATLNLGDDNKTGQRTRRTRRSRLLTELLSPGATITFMQEAPVNGIYKWLTAQVKKRAKGRNQGHREIDGKYGRRTWASKRGTRLAGGTHTPAQHGVSIGKPRAPKPFTWSIVRIDGFRVRLAVNVHGPYGILPKKKRRYWDQVLTEVDRLRRHYGLERRQVVIGGDTNAPKAARKAAKPYGLVDARLIARKTSGARYGTTNGWKPRLRTGGRPDMILLDKDAAVLDYKNLAVRSTTTGQAVTDHNHIIITVA